MVLEPFTRYKAVLAAPFGRISLEADDVRLLSIGLSDEAEAHPLIEPATPLLKEAARQILAYLQNPSQRFELPLASEGTAFRQKVWQAMANIPAGSVKTYGQLARELGSGPRAVAGACKANEFPIVIPCHRVVASDGLGGYCGRLGGPMLEIKRWLLRHEGHEFP